MSRDDEVRLLHESYQFLVRKYHLQSPDEDKEFRNDKKSTNQENVDLVTLFLPLIVPVALFNNKSCSF